MERKKTTTIDQEKRGRKKIERKKKRKREKDGKKTKEERAARASLKSLKTSHNKRNYLVLAGRLGSARQKLIYLGVARYTCVDTGVCIVRISNECVMCEQRYMCEYMSIV